MTYYTMSQWQSSQRSRVEVFPLHHWQLLTDMCRDTAWFLCDRSSAIALMHALVMTLLCYGTLEIVCVLLLLLLLVFLSLHHLSVLNRWLTYADLSVLWLHIPARLPRPSFNNNNYNNSQICKAPYAKLQTTYYTTLLGFILIFV